MSCAEVEVGAAKKEIGQKIEFKFMLHEPGHFNLTFVLMPSCWIGCDVSVPVSLNVSRQTHAEKTGKSQRRGGHGNPAPTDGSDDSSNVRLLVELLTLTCAATRTSLLTTEILLSSWGRPSGYALRDGPLLGSCLPSRGYSVCLGNALPIV
jgi:hypothetical protein